jgi:hypothetical protein
VIGKRRLVNCASWIHAPHSAIHDPQLRKSLGRADRAFPVGLL